MFNLLSSSACLRLDSSIWNIKNKQFKNIINHTIHSYDFNRAERKMSMTSAVDRIVWASEWDIVQRNWSVKSHESCSVRPLYTWRHKNHLKQS